MKTIGEQIDEQYKQILRQELATRVERNPRYSMRAFAQVLGMDPGALSQILAGTRIPSQKVAEKLAEKLGLSPNERERFFLSLAERHRLRDLKRKSPFFKKLQKAANVEQSHKKELTADLFRIISDWYHYAILGLTLTEGFQSNERWIANQLGLSLSEVKLAIERLKDLGMLEEQDGRLVRTVPPLDTADKTLTSAAHRKRQKQILEKASVALEEVPIEERNHSAMTMVIDPSLIPEAKKRIQKFTDELNQFLESGKRQQVYEMSVCLFPLQKKEERK